MLFTPLPIRPSCLCLILSVILLASPPTWAKQDEADYEQQLKTLSKNIDKLQKELSSTRSDRDKLQQRLQKSEEEISDLNKRINTIKEALDREKKQLSQHQSQRAELEKSRQSQEQEVSQIVSQAYQLGRQSQVKLLLNQEGPTRVTRLLRYHDYIIAAHKEKIDRYIETIQALSQTETRILESSQRLEEQQLTLNKRFGELRETQAQRLATLGELNRSLDQKGGSLSKMRDDRERLERLLEEATRALSQLKLPEDAKPFPSVRGKLPYPTKGRVANQYGSAKVNGRLRWDGIFIEGKAGTPVVSVHYGRVIFSDYLRGQGLLLIIDHGDGYMSLYAHNQVLLKETGEWVSTNEPIAMLGNTGGQTQAGLYFEIRHKGKPQNPSPWLAGRG